MNDHCTVVIVGASAAGLATATALRRKGHQGSITLLGEEAGVPYDRPPLSKQFLSGSWEADRLDLLPENRLGGLDLDLRVGTRARSLDADTRVVVDDTGTTHRGDHVVVATGLRSRALPLFTGPAVHVMRTRQDAERLRSVLRPGLRMAVIGAGFLGLETAATVASLGAAVTVVEPMERPLANRIGEIAADRLMSLHRSRGVRVLSGVGAQSAAARGGVTDVVLTSGERLEVDVVLVAVGSAPCTDWLAGSGLTVDDGVVCDEFCRAAPRVWAAGDVARWRHRGLDRHVRIEHRTNATEQGQHVAAGILGSPAPYVPVPFFWTDHYDARIQVAGVITAEADESRQDIQGREGSFLSLFHQDDELVAALAWNAPRELSHYRRRLLELAAVKEAVA